MNKQLKLWVRLQKEAWRLPPLYPGAVFFFPEKQGGLAIPYPKVDYSLSYRPMQLLALHVEQLALWDNDVLACAGPQYTHLSSCHSQAELTEACWRATGHLSVLWLISSTWQESWV